MSRMIVSQENKSHLSSNDFWYDNEIPCVAINLIPVSSSDFANQNKFTSNEG